MADSEQEVKKELYVSPKILATYTRQELAEAIRPHGSLGSYDQNGGTDVPDA